MVNLATLDLNLLRVLDALLRERSTVRAGERLGLSQPAVSAALGRLRHALNDPILVRQGQSMVPTVFAEGLEEPLHQSLHRLELMLRGRPGFDPQQAAFDFRLSASDYFATTLMPELVCRVAAQAPEVRVQLVNLVPDGHIDPLDRYEVDLALLPQGDFPAWVDSAPLFCSDFVAIARVGHPEVAGVEPGTCLPLDLFCALEHVLCSPEGRWKGLGDAALAKAGRKRRVAVSVPFFQAVLSIVAGSDLIALVPRSLLGPASAQAGLEVYLPPLPLTPPQICMIWHRRHTGDPGHDWMREQIAAILRPNG